MTKKQNKNNQSQSIIKQTQIEKTEEMWNLEREISAIQEKLFKARNQKAELDKSKKEQEKYLAKLQADEQKQQEELRKLEKEGFEIREAIRVIEELKLTENTESANAEILSLIQSDSNGKNIHSDNDDKTLAIATRYKLNDVVLYTDDKNLRNKAVAIGIKIGEK